MRKAKRESYINIIIGIAIFLIGVIFIAIKEQNTMFEAFGNIFLTGGLAFFMFTIQILFEKKIKIHKTAIQIISIILILITSAISFVLTMKRANSSVVTITCVLITIEVSFGLSTMQNEIEKELEEK